MPTHRLVIGFCTSVLLASCTVDTRSTPPPILPVSSSAGSSVSSSVGSDELLENADMDAAPLPKETSSTSAGHLEERILENGVLEVGNPDAPVTVLMFTNHSCHYCGEFASSDFLRLERDYIATGKVRYQIAILPLEKYPQTALQARTLLCSAKQNKGLAMHQLLFGITRVTASDMLAAGKTVKLDEAALKSCLESPEMDPFIELQSELARTLDVSLIPTFLVNDKKFVGLYRYDDMKVPVEEALKTK